MRDQPHADPGIDHGIARQIDHEVGAELLHRGDEPVDGVAGRRHHLGNAVGGRFVGGELLGAAEQDGADDVETLRPQVLDGGAHDRRVVLAIDEDKGANGSALDDPPRREPARDGARRGVDL